MQRVIVRLKKNGEFKIPKFSECVLHYFTKESNFTTVSCVQQGNNLTLAAHENGHKLQHSPECPIRILSENEYGENRSNEIKPEKIHQNISVAVSVIIESSDNHVLLTKRAAHMRSSPRVWVPPGGHLEPGETLFEGGVREVREETGLNISNGKAHILCLWENVYPLLLGVGPPSSHVLVVYYHVKMNETFRELQKYVKLDPDEVASCCWLSASTIGQLFNYKTTDVIHKEFILENGDIIERELDVNTMFNKYLWTKKESYSGTQCALRNWLEKHVFQEGNPCKF